MDPNVKDILLVVLGAAGSLLGTAFTLFFELRKDRRNAEREAKNADYERLEHYLFTLSSLSAGISHLYRLEASGMNISRPEYVQNNIEPILSKLADSPLHGLPPLLMTRDKQLVKNLEAIQTHHVHIQGLIALLSSPTKPDKTFAQEQNKKNAELNELIDVILTDAQTRII